MRMVHGVTITTLLLLGLGGPAAGQEMGPECWVRGDRADLEFHASPYDSASVSLDAGTVKVCYSRPRKLGRPIMGGWYRSVQPGGSAPTKRPPFMCRAAPPSPVSASDRDGTP